MENKSDIEVMNRILQGETGLYAILVDRYKNMAYTIAYRITGVREDSEEIVQDAFLKVYKNLAGFKREAKFSTWLYRIVYNTAVSKKRLKKMPVKPLEEAYESIITEEPGKESGFDEEDRSKIIEKVLSCLSEDDRTIITLFYLNESSIEEIQSVTGLTKTNIKVRLFRSRKKIQDYMSGFSQIVYV